VLGLSGVPQGRGRWERPVLREGKLLSQESRRRGTRLGRLLRRCLASYRHNAGLQFQAVGGSLQPCTHN
jgi:hypothetical protein